MAKKLYIIGDGEVLYPGYPDGQYSDNNEPEPLTSMSEARAALKQWNEELGYSPADDVPSPLCIYELKRVK
jgi:hypothetical protein